MSKELHQFADRLAQIRNNHVPSGLLHKELTLLIHEIRTANTLPGSVATERTLVVPIDVWNVMHELSVEQDLTLEQVLKQSVASYQLQVHEAKHGPLGLPMLSEEPAPSTPESREELELVIHERDQASRAEDESTRARINLTDQLIAAIREKKQAEASRDKAMAECAALREVHNQRKRLLDYIGIGLAGTEFQRLSDRIFELYKEESKALSTDSGRDFLNRMETMRRALEEIQQLTDDGFQHSSSGYRISRISTLCGKALYGPPSEYMSKAQYDQLRAAVVDDLGHRPHENGCTCTTCAVFDVIEREAAK